MKIFAHSIRHHLLLSLFTLPVVFTTRLQLARTHTRAVFYASCALPGGLVPGFTVVLEPAYAARLGLDFRTFLRIQPISCGHVLLEGKRQEAMCRFGCPIVSEAVPGCPTEYPLVPVFAV